MTLDFRQPGVDDAVEGLPVTDREAEDQHLTGVVCVGSETLMVTLNKHTKKDKTVNNPLSYVVIMLRPILVWMYSW